MGKINKKICTFLILIVLFGLFPYYKIITLGMKSAVIYVISIMFVPAVSALITKLVYDKTLKGLGFGIKKEMFKYLGLSFILPVVAGVSVYSIVWITGIGGFEAGEFRDLIHLIIFSIVGTLGNVLIVLGEEIGWRGFLAAELYKEYSYTKTAIITGIIWALYHYPILLFGDYNNGVSIIASLIFFTISVFAFGSIANFLRLKSGSLWPAAMLHAAHNLFIQQIFDVMTIDTGKTKLITTEFGCGLAIFYALIAFYFWKKRSEIRHSV